MINNILNGNDSSTPDYSGQNKKSSKKTKSEKAGSVMFWFGIALFVVVFAASKFLYKERNLQNQARKPTVPVMSD